MRKRYLLPAILLLLCTGFYACTKVSEALANAESLAWHGVDVTITVPPISDTTTHTIGSGTFSYNLDSFIKSQTSNKLGLANLDTLQFLSCTLDIQNASANSNFANFEMASVSASTNINTTPQAIEIDNNPDVSASELIIPANNTTNLKSYLSATGTTVFTYALSGKFRRPTDSTLTVNVHVEYHIHVKP